MGYEARVLRDSISPDDVRLTTMVVTFPRIVLAEFNTHRMLSRNSASSRAIPIAKQIERVMNDPFEPVWWGKNQAGMQANEELSDTDTCWGGRPNGWFLMDHRGWKSSRAAAREQWFTARDSAVEQVKHLMELGAHKQIVNRLLEPFMWHTVIVTATEWDNFFGLRCHKDAQPEIRVAAEMMREKYWGSVPDRLNYGEWHLPYVERDEVNGDLSEKWIRISCARCARVSHLTHEGKRDPDADLSLAARLIEPGHMSPFEHAARPLAPGTGQGDPAQRFVGNFRGWIQYRKTLPFESNFAQRPK